MNTCKWHKDGQHMPDHDYWETSCGNIFQFNVDGPNENHFKFCPYCGLPIGVVEVAEGVVG